MKVNGVEIAERWASEYASLTDGRIIAGRATRFKRCIEELSQAEAQVAEAEEYLPEPTGPYQTLGERAKLLKDQMEYAAESSGLLSQRIAELEAQLASIKAEYTATALANGRLQAENTRLKAPVTHKEVGEIDKRRLEWNEDVSAGTAMKYALTEWIVARAVKEAADDVRSDH